MALQFFDVAGGTASFDGIFIPVANLPGVTASELATAEGTKRISRVVAALLEQIYTVLSPTNFRKLGFAVTKTNPSVVGNSLSITYGTTIQRLSNTGSGTTTMIPVPTTGTNSGQGDFALFDVFSGSTIVDSADVIAGAGVILPYSELQGYGAPQWSGLDIGGGEDNRDLLAAIISYLHDSADVIVRTNSVLSAVTNRSVSAPQLVVMPSTAYFTAVTNVNPTTGLSTSDIDINAIFSRTYSMTVQFAIALANLDVNHVAV